MKLTHTISFVAMIKQDRHSSMHNELIHDRHPFVHIVNRSIVRAFLISYLFLSPPPKRNEK